jgi:hypothetical protein
VSSLPRDLAVCGRGPKTRLDNVSEYRQYFDADKPLEAPLIFRRIFQSHFKRLYDCSREDFAQAGIEVSIVCLSAFLPIWLSLLVWSLTNLQEAFILSFMTAGDILLISCAIIGPLIYVLTKKHGQVEDPLTLRFPYSPGLSVLILIIWVIAGVVFVLQKTSDLHLISANILNRHAIWDLSIAIAIGSIAVLYFATVFRNNMGHSEPAAIMHDEQEEFVKEYGDG